MVLQVLKAMHLLELSTKTPRKNLDVAKEIEATVFDNLNKHLPYSRSLASGQAPNRGKERRSTARESIRVSVSQKNLSK